MLRRSQTARFAIHAVFLASTCFLAACVESSGEPVELEGCVTKNQCKFDRVCAESVCVEPDDDESEDPTDPDPGDGTSGRDDSTGGDSNSEGGTSGTSDDGSCECEEDTDCGREGICVACICVSDTSGSACTAPPCDACGNCEGCVACVQGEGGSCQGANADCNANAECLALLSCANACAGGSACLQQCLADHPAGQTDFTSLRDCVLAGCATSCA